MKTFAAIITLTILASIPTLAAADPVPAGYGPYTYTVTHPWQPTTYPDGRQLWNNIDTDESFWTAENNEPGLRSSDDFGGCLHPASFGRWRWAATGNVDCATTNNVVAQAVKGRKRIAGWKCNRAKRQVSCRKATRKVTARQISEQKAEQVFDKAVAFCGFFYAYRDSRTVYAKDERACRSTESLGWKLAAAVTEAGNLGSQRITIPECALNTVNGYQNSCATEYGCLVFAKLGGPPSAFVKVEGIRMLIFNEPESGMPAC